ncbi:MAG: hypothetical protein E6K53_14150 [Gammaproteobacteria bacterium]|nr:MAG: hypothetical protein E6K53_14150 [Gammaproteobacteria bacterium]
MLLLMAIYLPLMLLEWPHVRQITSLPLKCVLTLLPTLPVIGVIWLIGKRIARSDELEQRVHLIALGAATGVVSVLSLIGGFLSAAHVIELDGDVLIWVFPVLCLVYSITQIALQRRYGVHGCD